MRTDRDFVARHRDRRGRQPTVCGVLARPSRLHFKRRSHHDFVPFSPGACRRCAELITPPVDPRTVEITQLGPLHERSRAQIVEWVHQFEPHHPFRSNPACYAIITGIRLHTAAA
jgi:hypothetical protein